MSERVNIQYSVDIEDLGDEVCRLICDAYENLNAINDSAEAPANNVLSLQAIQKIDEIRQRLGDLDSRLSDVVNIINGYISYKSQVINQQEIGAEVDNQRHENGEPTPDYDSVTESLANLPDLSNLQELLKQFKDENETADQG
jgi:hypothetical protein